MTNHTHAPTRSDVAAKAGVSETIVSYVLNNNRYVSEEKRQRVLAAVAELHYRPNSIARALKGKGSGHILFIADHIDNEYFGRLVRQIDKLIYDKGFLISLLAVRNHPDFVSRILASQVDAVVISSSALEEKYVQQLIDFGIPVVLLMTRDYASITGPVSRIYTGIESGIMAAVRYMYETGCRHLVHIDRISTSGHFSNRRDLRYRGFCNQMEALQLPLTASSFISGYSDNEQLFHAICARIKSDEPVDGFVCRNDQLACVAVSAVQACGKRCPEDISIIGFDNSSVSSLIYPPISTMDQDQGQIAQAVLELVDMLLKTGETQERFLNAKIVLRKTTRSI